MKNYYLILCSVLFLTSCMKEELPIPKHDPGNVITNSVDIGATYKWQVYFNLQNNTVVGKNLKTDWDLGFETSETGYRVVLNSSKVMFARETGSTDFASVVDTAGFESAKKYDKPNGDMNYTAIGDWKTTPNQVYVIDRGYNDIGAHQGFRKIVFQSVDNTSYSIKFANLNGSNENTIIIPKDSNYNFTFFSFSTMSTVSVEPPKKDWDIVFTQYLEDLGTPYLVTGCLINRHETSAATDSITDFSSITYDFAQTKTLTQNLNTIGYDWKEYDFDNSSYTIFPHKNYIVKDKNGYYYKLHFIDFYNTSGVKGNPTFEFQKL
ncbi:MAG: HmuY family protein [Flavobacteriales bacterium]|nr:HmuY family protein [Flavobacteriales bacterium]